MMVVMVAGLGGFQASRKTVLADTACSSWGVRARLKRDGTHPETRFSLSAKRTSPFELDGGSVQSTTGNRGVRISCSNGSNAGYTMFRGRVQAYWLPTPLACFPITSPTERHRVPSGFNWALPVMSEAVAMYRPIPALETCVVTTANTKHCVSGNGYCDIVSDAAIALQQHRQCALRRWQASALYSGRAAGASSYAVRPSPFSEYANPYGYIVIKYLIFTFIFR